MSQSTPVSTIMSSDVVTLALDTSVPEAADVLAEHRIGAAPVVDPGGKLVGMLRDEDLMVSEARLHVPSVIEFLGAELVWPPSVHRYEAELRKAAASTVEEVMITEFPTVASTATVEAVATLMHDHGVSHVPVVDEGRVVGIVARGDLVRYLAATT
jgi:CBS domain-containing protein